MKLAHLPLLAFVLFISTEIFSQDINSALSNKHVSGSVSITNNGISLIPTFSLGKPALLSNIAYTKKKLSFEADINFANDGKPWFSLFWMRYKLVNQDKFTLRIGSHLGLNYKRVNLKTPLDSAQVLLCERYLVAEIAPNYQINKNFSVGIYYLFSHGLDYGTNNANHFLTLNSTISNISIGKELVLSLTPQIYFLKMDKNEGYYLTGAIKLAKRNSPYALTSVFNKVINTEINPQDDFVYNFSLTYLFGNHKVF